jgi:hypothetical protein
MLYPAYGLLFGSALGDQNNGNIVVIQVEEAQRVRPSHCGDGITGKDYIDLIAEHPHIVVGIANRIPGYQKANTSEFAQQALSFVGAIFEDQNTERRKHSFLVLQLQDRRKSYICFWHIQ